MRDEWFVRGQVPMTKSEVRSVSLAKLELKPDSIVYDIGAGTGSVSIESAFAAPKGHVYAIEQKEDACKLILENKELFQVKNLTLVEGKAPQIMAGLPVPTHAFIGGTSGCLEEIIHVLYGMNPKIRIVINVIALETLSDLVNVMKNRGIEPEIISLQVSKANKIGNYHLMQGQNPVYIISFGGDT